MQFETLERTWVFQNTASRKAVVISREVHRRLAAYALIAGASGTMVAQSGPHQDIFYTPADIHFQGLGATTTPIDFNHDGITDITLSATNKAWHASSSPGFGSRGSIYEVPAGGNAAIVSALPRGVDIGPANNNFDGARRSLAYGYIGGNSGHSAYGTGGPFANITDEYLGVKFLIDGQTHFGWIRLTVEAGYGSIAFTVSGYAYNRTPREALKAGEGTPQRRPRASNHGPTLGVLGFGASAIQFWRTNAGAGVCD